MIEDLINYWKQLDLSAKPYVHGADIFLKNEYCFLPNDYEEYVANKDFWINKSLFHTNLIPIPFIGNLKTAKIFILLLNPGLHLADYYAEQTAPNYVDELKRNLTQENLNSEYPFIFLNPKFLWHPGGQYWLNKLKDYILDISKNKKCSYTEALSYVATRIAVLELIPYHSNNYKHGNLVNKLESARQMKDFVNRFIIPKVWANECCIICTRKSKEWGLPLHENILNYEGSESRAAHLSKNSRAYKKITAFLKD